MPGRVEGKVAFITGAARGQGRSHAIRLAEEGADIIAVDLCEQVASVPYGMATAADLAETVKEVEALDRRIVAIHADVRDFSALQAALDAGVAELGGLDIVSANAGIFSTAPTVELPEQSWRDMIDINLTGVWHAAKAAIPTLIEGGRGGSIVLTSSTAGLKGGPNIGHYSAAKHGVVGLMRTPGPGAGPPLHPGELDPPDDGQHRHDPQRRHVRLVPDPTWSTRRSMTPARPSSASMPCPSNGSRRSTSPTRCSSWRPTRPATSPASRCPSTPAASSSSRCETHPTGIAKAGRPSARASGGPCACGTGGTRSGGSCRASGHCPRSSCELRRRGR